MTDYDRFVKACTAWKYSDPTLEVTFRPGRWLPNYVQEAVCELRGYEFHPVAVHREFPPGFYAECVDLVEKRNSELRSKVLSMVKQEDRNRKASRSQLTLFD